MSDGLTDSGRGAAVSLARRMSPGGKGTGGVRVRGQEMVLEVTLTGHHGQALFQGQADTFVD